jgi:hypothetical protein
MTRRRHEVAGGRAAAVVVFLSLGVALSGSRGGERPAEVTSLRPEELQEFADQPEEVQALLRYALSLTERNLAYRFGSCDPGRGGMDCSGTVHHVLRHQGRDAPRQSDAWYRWVEDGGELFRVKGAETPADPALAGLLPGDLLFWEGTYETGKRNPPTSHVMIYLGRLKSNGAPVMVGASSGRTFAGKARHGVSVFDFALPRRGSSSRFVAYGSAPGLARPDRSGNGGEHGLGERLRKLLPAP